MKRCNSKGFGIEPIARRVFRLLCIVLVGFGLGHQRAAAQAACSYVISGPAAGTSVDVGGTSVGLGDDQVTGALGIGFNFNFFGATYNQFVISSNGFISFDLAAGAGCCSGQVLPNNTTPNNLVAGFWEDFAPNVGGTIGYGVFGTAPARRLVVSYTNVQHYPSGTPVTFQIKLHETSNVVEVVSINCPTDGGNHTQGIDNLGGSVAFVPSGRNSANFSSINETTTFTPVDATAPAISCPGNISVPCTQVVTFSNASATDNCQLARVAQIAGLASGATFPTGTNTVTFRARDHGSAGVFNNGAGGTFSYNEGDSPQTIALKACESAYGTGNCVVGACGSFTYYYRSGHPNCNCGKVAGQYEFVYSNAGYVDVGQDYGGTNAPVSFVPFVRVKGPNGCSVPNTWLLSNDRLGGNFADCSFSVIVGSGVTASNAGPDQTLCGTSATLAANTPTVGTGSWSIIAGAGGTVTTASSPTSGFTGVAGTTYTLRWTIAQAPCASSTDDVIITLRANPTAAGAGPDQSICGNAGTLAGNTATVGTGTWTIVAGAGGGIVTPTSPNSTVFGATGTTYTLRWTIANAPCVSTFDDVFITFVGAPTASNAGPDQTLCATSATLAGNAATVGAGSWSIISGAGGACVTPTSATSAFNGVAGTAYTLRWTIANAPCVASADDVNITLRETPTVSAAGPDQVLCGTSATLAANTPTVGTGAWSIVSGAGGSIGTASSPTSGFTGVIGTTYTLRWTIANAPCSPSTDDVVISFTGSTPASNAGPDQTICGTSATLAANTPGVGTGTWTIVSGAGGTINSPNSPSSTFTAVAGNIYTLRWTITNPPCSPSSDDVVITTDVVNPAITCPANATGNTDPAGCTATVSYTTPIGTDNCPSPSTTQTSGLASGSAFPAGVTTNVFQVTDGAGRTSTCSFTVTVTDNELPVLSCPANISVANNPGACTATPSYSTPSGTDNCASASTTQTLGLASGASFPLGITTNTFRVTDAAGNTATCSFTVTVSDAELPVLNCPATITANNTVGACNAVVSFASPAGTDNCTGVSTSQTVGLASGSTFPIGTTTNSFQATDAAGNTSSCSFVVVVADAELPAVSCPPSFNLNVNTGLCTAVVPYPPITGTDNCPGATTSQTLGLPTGAAFPLGATTCTFVVTDAAGNTASCSFTATVIDNEAPTLSCPGNLPLSTDPGACTATGNYSNPAGSDNCVGGTFAQTSGQASGSSFPIGTTTNAFLVTDGSGNTATCSFVVTVADNELPTITCPAPINVTAGVGSCTAVATYISPVGTDNCAGASTVLTAGLPSGSNFPVGVTSVKFTTTDASGNTSSCTFPVTVTDAELPLISCPANMTVNTNVGSCAASPTFAPPVGTDNCIGVSTAQIAGQPSGTSLSVGVATNTFQVTDAGGNSASCAFTITVVDNQGPAITCPANLTLGSSPGVCGAVVNYTTPVGTDNCTPTTTQVAGLASGATFPLGTTTNTYSVSDGASNTATCSFTVIVTDTQSPTWSTGCPANQTVGTSINSCNAVVTWTPPVASDNCSVASSSGTQVSGSTFAIGLTTVTYTAADVAGNSTTCAFTVTVNDNVPPVALCHSATVVLDANGNGSLTPAGVNNGSTDNCSVASTSLSQSTFTCANAGGSTIVLIVTDASGNTSTCSASITVIAPAVGGSATTTTNTCGFNVSCNGGNDGVATAAGSGGCPGYTYLWSNGATTATATGLSAGLHTVTITGAAGGSFVTTVTLTAPPALLATSTTTQSCIGDSTGAIDLTVAGGNSCQPYTYGWSNGASTEDLNNVAAGSYTVTVTDLAGCSTVHTVTVGSFPALNPTFTASGNLLTCVQSFTSYQWLLNGSAIGGATASTYTVTQSGSYSLLVTDVNGCSATSDTTNLTIVGLQDAMGDWMGLSIYPNPARNEFRLRTAAPIGYSITVTVNDMFGHRFSETVLPELGHEAAFDIKAFSAGTYVVEVVSEFGQRKLFRLVVQ